MSYHLPQVRQRVALGIQPLSSPPDQDSGSALKTVGIVVLVGGGLGLLGLLIYSSIKTRQAIVKKHGVDGLLAYEGGMAAINVLGGAFRSGRF